MSVPAEIPGIGSTTQKLRANPGFDAMASGIGPEEYFVLSRIDGALTLRDVLLMTGLPIERAVEVITKLRKLGAVLLPGETPTTVPRPPTNPPVSRAPRPPVVPAADAAGKSGSMPALPRTRTGQVPRTKRGEGVPEPIEDNKTSEIDMRLVDPTAEELAALGEECDLGDDERRRILGMARRVGREDAWALFGLPQGADKKRIKRVYFRLSKDFHPDRFYGKRTGSFAGRLERVFEALARAYEELSEGKPRGSAAAGEHRTGEAPQSPVEYAAELYERACQTEVHANPMDAMKLFAAAIRIDPQLKYLKRAARCALTADQPRTAEEYANKAAHAEPNDPSVARLLAAAFRAQGKLDAAEEVLIMALAVPMENDSLLVELRRDLTEIRKAQSQNR